MTNNFLFLNSTFFKFLLVGPKQLWLTLSRHQPTLDVTSLTCNTSIKNVIINQDLLDSHIKQISKTSFSNSSTQWCQNQRHPIPLRCRKTNPRFYYVATRLLQCSPVRNNNSIKSHQPIHCAAARTLTRSKKYEHISPALASLPPCISRLDCKVLLLTYKALNGLALNYLKELVVPYCPPRSLRSQSAGLLVIPRISKSTTEGRALCYRAPLLWNNLPASIWGADTLFIFKSRLKTFLFITSHSHE